MKVVILNKKVSKIILDDNKLINTVGLELAKKIRQRYDQIEASDNFKDYLDYKIGNPHLLTGNLKNSFGINLNGNYRMIVEPSTENLDEKSLRECKEVILKGVCDYHGAKIEWIIP